MLRTNGLYRWTSLVTSRFPELSRAQATVLALYSFGMVLARTSGLETVALQLALLLGQATNTLRQRLRELYQPASVKSGRQRTELDPTLCFAGLLRWITASWTDRRLVLAIDPTHVGERFLILTVSVVYQGCAIPVAWHVQRADHKGSWNWHWRRLLGHVLRTLGPGWDVTVLSDRGLESRRLFRAIVRLGAHPLMRVKAEGTFRPAGWHGAWRMGRFAGAPGRRWSGRGVAYQGRAALAGTLLACWEPGHDEPWLLLTDREPTAANPAWYAFRAWIEQGFKVLKSGGWQWQRSRVTDPKRAARQWAALALATLWLVEVGGETEKLMQPAEPKPAPQPQAPPPKRVHRLFQVGLAAILAWLLKGGDLPHGSFQPQPWPPMEHKSDSLTEEQMKQT
jgi:hypothetical protein